MLSERDTAYGVELKKREKCRFQKPKLGWASRERGEVLPCLILG